MGNFAENLNLGNRFRPPLLMVKPESGQAETSMNFYSEKCFENKVFFPLISQHKNFTTTLQSVGLFNIGLQ